VPNAIFMRVQDTEFASTSDNTPTKLIQDFDLKTQDKQSVMQSLSYTTASGSQDKINNLVADMISYGAVQAESVYDTAMDTNDLFNTFAFDFDETSQDFDIEQVIRRCNE